MYRLKKLWLDLFGYPNNDLTALRADTDTYWGARRKDLSKLSAWQQERADMIARLVPNGPYTLADIGCGGPGLILFLKKKTQLTHGVGYDNSSWVLDTLKEHNVEGRSVILDAEGEYSIEPADVITLMEIIEHIPHAESLVRAVYEKASKAVIFSVPNTGYVVYRLRLLFGRFPMQWRLHPGEHVRFWTLTDMRWWLRSMGFSKNTIITYRGVPILNKVWPSLFAAGFVVYLPKA
jgi:2-polyprenyl-3-methyl-5-hydroxy-6-metoxy-1,4-benzoquinol methylase